MDDKPAFDMDKFLERSRKIREAAVAVAEQIDFELVRFNGENAAIDFNVDWSHETVWATQQQIADLFGKDRNTIGHHISTMYADGELERSATTSNFGVVRKEGNRQVSREIEHYNLDVILSVGYRVSSVKATEFRKWATQTLRRYITDGFALNEARLRDDPRALRDLASQVRALRTGEKSIYQAVRDCVAVAANDYDKDNPQVRNFYARFQDKFLYAATGKTASELVLERADGTKHNMGLTVVKGKHPSRTEAKVGKNYLYRDEILILHIICEQFLLYAESKAIRGRTMTMHDLSGKLDALLETNDYAVFPGYRDFLKERAVEHAEIEWHRWSDAMSKGEALPAPSPVKAVL